MSAGALRRLPLALARGSPRVAQRAMAATSTAASASSSSLAAARSRSFLIFKRPAIVGGTIATLLATTASRNIAYAEDAAADLGERPTSIPSAGGSSSSSSSPFANFSVKDISMATVTGLVSGIFLKRLSTTVAFYVGAVAVGVQILAYFGLVTIQWQTVEERFRRVVDHDGDGRLTWSDLQGWVDTFFSKIAGDMKTRSMLIAGFWLGVRYG